MIFWGGKLLGLFPQTLEFSMPRSSDPSRRELWLNRLERYKHSSLSIAQFCAQEGICVSTFYQWRNKLTAAPGDGNKPDAPPRFLPVRISSTTIAPTIKLPGGAIIELPASVPPEQLSQWLTACIQATATNQSMRVSR
jgi:hypothetical protein